MNGGNNLKIKLFLLLVFMKRVYCSSILKQGSTYELEKKYYIHLVKVMRLKVGDHLSLFNNTSGEWESEIIDIKNNFLIAKPISQVSSPQAENLIDLMFSPIKYQNSESIIRQSTEMGIRSIFPTVFKRTINTKINLNKFNSYAIGATQQSGRLSIPNIDNLNDLKNRSKIISNRTILMFDEDLKGIPLSQLKIKSNSEILVVIGPEGGFEDEERVFISKSSKNFFNVSLGSNILKADTAVIAALSLTFHYFS